MVDLWKPDAATPESFGRIVLERALIKVGTSVVRDIAEYVHVSPSTVSDMLAGRFPGNPKNHTGHALRKFKEGRIASLARVCEILDLDLDACANACGLERNELVIARSRKSAKPILLDRADLEMLLGVVGTTGSLPIDVAVQLVQLRRDRKDAP